MATRRKILEVLQIMEAYPETNNDECDAQHDILNVGGPSPDQLSPEHRERLKALNVPWDEGLECWEIYT